MEGGGEGGDYIYPGFWAAVRGGEPRIVNIVPIDSQLESRVHDPMIVTTHHIIILPLTLSLPQSHKMIRVIFPNQNHIAA